MRKLIAAAVICLAVVAQIQAEDKPTADTLPGVTIRLVLSADEFNPLAPAKETVKCVIENKSDQPIDVPSIYDGRTVRLVLFGPPRPWAMELHPVPQNVGMLRGGGASPATQKFFSGLEPPPQVRIEPGHGKVMFEMPLDEILLLDRAAANAPKWQWWWTAESSPPPPLRLSFKGEYLKSVNLQAFVEIEGKYLSSDKVELKINPSVKK